MYYNELEEAALRDYHENPKSESEDYASEEEIEESQPHSTNNDIDASPSKGFEMEGGNIEMSNLKTKKNNRRDSSDDVQYQGGEGVKSKINSSKRNRNEGSADFISSILCCGRKNKND